MPLQALMQCCLRSERRETAGRRRHQVFRASDPGLVQLKGLAHAMVVSLLCLGTTLLGRRRRAPFTVGVIGRMSLQWSLAPADPRTSMAALTKGLGVIARMFFLANLVLPEILL